MLTATLCEPKPGHITLSPRWADGYVRGLEMKKAETVKSEKLDS